jgi:hypothetical protein
MPHYYEQDDYISKRAMRKLGYSENDKIEQRDVNWWLKVSFYVEHNKPQAFINIVEKWYNANYGRVPTMTMRQIASKVLKMDESIIEKSKIVRMFVDEYNRQNAFYGFI